MKIKSELGRNGSKTVRKGCFIYRERKRIDNRLKDDRLKVLIIEMQLITENCDCKPQTVMPL